MNQSINMMISGRGKCCGLVEPINDVAVPSLSFETERQTYESDGGDLNTSFMAHQR